MKAFTKHAGLVAPLDRANVDTDAIIPKQFLKSIKRTGFGPNLFDEWRYLDHGEPGMDNSTRPLNPDFVLNKKEYLGASILLARENFGCGSSREHAPWALKDFGFHVVIATSFADIFYNNCIKNGLLPITLPKDVIQTLFETSMTGRLTLTVDLAEQTISSDTHNHTFEIDEFAKYCLLNGLDEIGLTLQAKDKINAFEEKYRQNAPWLFGETK